MTKSVRTKSTPPLIDDTTNTVPAQRSAAQERAVTAAAAARVKRQQDAGLDARLLGNLNGNVDGTPVARLEAGEQSLSLRVRLPHADAQVWSGMTAVQRGELVAEALRARDKRP